MLLLWLNDDFLVIVFGGSWDVLGGSGGVLGRVGSLITGIVFCLVAVAVSLSGLRGVHGLTLVTDIGDETASVISLNINFMSEMDHISTSLHLGLPCR